MRRAHWLIVALVGLTGLGFDYLPAGSLISGSGSGRSDATVYAPGVRFPIQNAPAFANSQVYRPGGSQGGGGGQCDSSNYAYPWQDNYCESRRWDMPLCPSGTGHQGQDIRPSSCQAGVHPTVATENGQISRIGTYTVYLQGDSGTLYRYMHMDHSRLQVSSGQRVSRGTVLGYISNNMGSTPTTIHLHFDMKQAVSGLGSIYVPTYMTLVRAYESLLGEGPSDPTDPGDVTPVSCSVPDGRSGQCISTSSCDTPMESVAGYCPGGTDIQCCVTATTSQACNVPDGRSGTCEWTSECALESVPGYCPGADNYQCCVAPVATGPVCGDGICETGETCTTDCGGSTPAGWICDASTYGTRDGCDCECGAYDPDCSVAGQEVYGCAEGVACGSDGHCQSTSDPGTGDTPAGWTCDPANYDNRDGCDCECGAYDPDCGLAGAVVYNCRPGQSCSVFGFCYAVSVGGGDDPGTDPTPGDPAPPDWYCGDDTYGTRDGCHCRCGAYDPDCDVPSQPVLNCLSGDICVPDGVCQTPSEVEPEPSGPSGWICGEDTFGTRDGCHCECGGYDPDCGLLGQPVLNCADGMVCGISGHCESPADPGTTDPGTGTGGTDVPWGWTCDPSYYANGEGCDCACGAYDPDCDIPGEVVYGCYPGQVCGPGGGCYDPGAATPTDPVDTTDAGTTDRGTRGPDVGPAPLTGGARGCSAVPRSPTGLWALLGAVMLWRRRSARDSSARA